MCCHFLAIIWCCDSRVVEEMVKVVDDDDVDADMMVGREVKSKENSKGHRKRNSVTLLMTPFICDIGFNIPAGDHVMIIDEAQDIFLALIQDVYDNEITAVTH
ncbi:Hypothetical predicted protein [Octopus vulgaris]|uniref:Uncharacterized protein n=1 Tax=Octopus vulgaris TaxID=6645 RepID=A0AA36B7L4_OCTVU|nr:Hypothetical predicted protein [Octopus vulgaris]